MRYLLLLLMSFGVIAEKWGNKRLRNGFSRFFKGFGVSRLAIFAKPTLIIRSSLTNRQTITSVNSNGG